ncbi:uncharacterized protein B0H64DRAFT_420635 [Chaetomium fimeti]|uniref:Uncharacterized protein n=1 Tax=Chaetomium fimeti TaxID=1854472 RepID=A0AAE0H6K7_9PEZI|nr:hypothetical protein B0H64DRAFT_420635 [Chaetomium fimeti]
MISNAGKEKRQSESSESDRSTINLPTTAAFSGYRPFPSVMNLYGNFSGILQAFTQKLCGASEDDFLSSSSFYLRNGTTTKAPVLAAAGDELPIPFLIRLSDPKTAIKLPPLDTEKNPRDIVTEILCASSGKEHGVTFRFANEVGIKRRQREEFKWRETKGSKEDIRGHERQNRYTLYRLASNRPVASSSSSAPIPDNTQIVAKLAFCNVINVKHIFTLEFQGTGLMGELGDRWTLIVNGKSNKATVGVAQIIHSK